MSKTVEISSGKYFIDEIPTGKSNFDFCNLGIKLCNFKYFDVDTVGEMKGFFNVFVKQPTEKTVRGAMIWGISVDNWISYQIKSGGETLSDNQFSSSLSTLIDDNGDKRVVLIKKWSRNFKDVLITYDDVRELYDKLETPEQKNEQMLDVISIMIKDYFKDRLSKEKEKHFIKLCKENKEFTYERINFFIDRFEKDISDYLDYENKFVLHNDLLKTKAYWDERISETKEMIKKLDIFKKSL